MEEKGKDEKIDLSTGEREEGIRDLLEVLRSDNIKNIIKESESYLVLVTTLKKGHIRGFTSMGGNVEQETTLSIQAIKKIVNSLDVIEKSVEEVFEKRRKDKLK